MTLYLHAQVRPGAAQLTVGDVSMIGGSAEERHVSRQSLCG
jgi:hypothetical protein